MVASTETTAPRDRAQERFRALFASQLAPKLSRCRNTPGVNVPFGVSGSSTVMTSDFVPSGGAERTSGGIKSLPSQV